MDLQLQGITKRFRGTPTPVLDGVTIEVKKGDFFSLLGPSGCGKSTLLRTIAGFVKPDAGSVAIKGQDVTRNPPYRRDTAMVFQSYALFPHMTVRENISFGLRYRGVPSADRPARVAEALELVRLEGFGDRYSSELSGGQQQRVAIARAIATRPALLLLDEPLSNLDSRLRLQMRSELLRIHKDTGVTTVFVTHDQGEAFSMSDQVVVLNSGKVLQAGTPQDIFENPRDSFVVDFIGGTNALNCDIVGICDRNVRLRSETGLIIESRCTDVSGLGLGRLVTAHVREEQMRLSRMPGEENSLVGVVVQAQFFGATYSYVVQIGAEQFRVSLPNTRHNVFVEGETAYVAFDRESVVVVDRDR